MFPLFSYNADILGQHGKFPFQVKLTDLVFELFFCFFCFLKLYWQRIKVETIAEIGKVPYN